ncbi:MAG: DUF1893 domain-containing protein [Clostridiales bacterium]|nr:DUF1893 domain-containing protein [Clostridiales bacterium]
MNRNRVTDLIKHKLVSENLTCVISDNKEIIFTSKKRGVTPLIDFINSLKNKDNYYLADKVIGKAAALLCIKAGIIYVTTLVISTPAKIIFQKNAITFEFETEVCAISNRDNTGLCPMENLSNGIATPDEMYDKVVLWLASK